jgi:hypothetical protein
MTECFGFTPGGNSASGGKENEQYAKSDDGNPVTLVP